MFLAHSFVTKLPKPCFHEVCFRLACNSCRVVRYFASLKELSRDWIYLQLTLNLAFSFVRVDPALDDIIRGVIEFAWNTGRGECVLQERCDHSVFMRLVERQT